MRPLGASSGDDGLVFVFRIYCVLLRLVGFVNGKDKALHSGLLAAWLDGSMGGCMDGWIVFMLLLSYCLPGWVACLSSIVCGLNTYSMEYITYLC
jgi:hypothetical protein